MDLLQPRLLACLALLLGYVLLVRLLRYRLLARATAQYPTRSSLSRMPVATAQAIFRLTTTQEFPLMSKRALQFALFRTYGIPSISSLLLSTSLFAAPESASKRYADTQVLVLEFIVRDVGSPAWVEALARLNCIHAKYVASGRISNDDLLYTLALFAREPERWIQRHEWRRLSDVERCAMGVFWKTVGDAMDIDMGPLPARAAGGEWRDGLHWLEDISDWADRYEEDRMLPHEANAAVARQTTAILLWNVPRRWKPLGVQAIGALMDQRLRTAMAFERPSETVDRLVQAALAARAFCLRHLALPRPYLLRYRSISENPTPCGTYAMLEYDSLPYYVRPSLFNRWGPEALVRRLRGLPVPGDEGNKYHPQGYRTREVGPPHGKLGQGESEKRVEVVGQRRCPMAFA
jgi:hypothetical protein